MLEKINPFSGVIILTLCVFQVKYHWVKFKNFFYANTFQEK